MSSGQGKPSRTGRAADTQLRGSCPSPPPILSAVKAWRWTEALSSMRCLRWVLEKERQGRISVAPKLGCQLSRLLEMQVIRSCLRFASETVGLGPAHQAALMCAHSENLLSGIPRIGRPSTGSPATAAVLGAGIHTSAPRRRPCLSARTTGRVCGGIPDCSS